MKLHRFLIDFDISADNLELTNLELVHQLHKVLRARVGFEFILTNGEEEVTVRVTKVLPKGLDVVVIDRQEVQEDEAPEVTLYCAILKRDNFELVVQKATEIGIKHIIPLNTERTIKQNIRPERIQAIIKEAVEQSGRVILPTLGPITTVSEALAQRANFDHMIFCNAGGETYDWDQIKNSQTAAIMIGPEGGWSPKEIEAAKAANVTTVSLGEYTLRAETAAIVASYLATE